jgi:hypothetical protein
MNLISVEEFGLYMIIFYTGRLSGSCDNVQPFCYVQALHFLLINCSHSETEATLYGVVCTPYITGDVENVSC